ncbi:MAG: TerB family tellurite resistance protein [Hyphomicrobiaceae bacterium]
MSIWNKIVRRAAGAVRGGSLAAILGQERPDREYPDDRTLDVTFTIAMIALSAKMAKSDGFVMADEVEAFHRVCRFPASETENVRRIFTLAQQDIAGYDVYARQIAKTLADKPEVRRDVLEGLFVIAAADGILHEKEDEFLRSVAGHLGIGDAEFCWVRSLFVAEQADPYTVLGIDPSATNAEIKARHRALSFEHHPDRLTGRGVPQDFVIIAERKLASINAAYDAIAKERNI